ncbi:MAG TPA: tellurite resistance TerB family protein, partial [Woeseiaceae bacterium]|nr:tellurite resistance TerB family protein [Woeseiaceae bacterium]
QKLLQGLTSSGAVSGFAGGLAGSALVGAISGKKGKKMAKGALKVGALAAVGGLAYTAYQRYRQGDPANNGRWAQHIPEERFAAVVDAGQDNGALLLLRAMITAAASDGHMDSDERDRVFDEAGKLDLSAQEKATLFDELQRPLTMRDLVSQVDSPEVAVEVYAASLVAIDETREEGRTYLRALSLALDLPPELVSSVHEQVAAADKEGVTRQ